MVNTNATDDLSGPHYPTSDFSEAPVPAFLLLRTETCQVFKYEMEITRSSRGIMEP
jgi:hypothetical protein